MRKIEQYNFKTILANANTSLSIESEYETMFARCRNDNQDSITWKSDTLINRKISIEVGYPTQKYNEFEEELLNLINKYFVDEEGKIVLSDVEYNTTLENEKVFKMHYKNK